MDNTLQELQELRAYIKASGIESPSPNYAAISAYIETNIINNRELLFKRRVPPLDIILLAIRSLLAPPNSPRVSDVPDLLDFATTIEFYRKLALQRVAEALKIHRYYQANDDGPTKLTDEEVKRLREYQTNDSAVRDVYIEVVLQYCQWDIYHLWTSDPPRAADVALRLCEYFPELNEIYQNASTESPRLFHYDLTDLECEAVRLRGVDSCRFVSDSCEWARASKLPGQTLASVFQTPEFALAFPCDIYPAKLRETMEFYMAAVERMVKGLQEMFP